LNKNQHRFPSPNPSPFHSLPYSSPRRENWRPVSEHSGGSVEVV
jgi:hypothetical protein